MRSLVRRVTVGGTAAVVGALGLSVPAAHAAVGCNTVVKTDIILTANLGPCSTDGLIAGADNITINLRGHLISGDGNYKAVPPKAGVRVSGHTGVKVINGRIEQFNAGVFIETGSKNVVSAIQASKNRGPLESELRDGILLSGTSGNVISGNTTTDNGSPRLASGGISMINQTLRNTVTNNTSNDNVGSGIRVDAGGGTSNTISGNVVMRNGFAGVSASFDASDTKVLNNTIRNNAGNGFQTSFGAERVLVRDNVITGNGGSGIALGTGSNIVESNTVNSNGANGISATGGSLFQSPDGIGDFIRRDNTIQFNKVFDNAANGILVQCPNDFVSPTAPPGGTRGACLTAATSHGFDINGNNKILSNKTGRNGGANAGVQTRDASGNVTGTYDLLDQNEHPPCDANTWSHNTFDTAFPACTKA